MYYDDDDDPYAPRIGPAAMPSPRSKFAPYYSGCADSFEDFVEEFEALAYDCALTDPQRVDMIIRYVDPSIREFWKSLNGYRSRDWPLFRQSLVTIFGNPIPRHQIMRQKLHSHVQDSSRRRMDCEDDVSQYYRQFLCYSAPLVHTGHLSEEERDAAFWYGFHPEDRKVVWPRLLGKNPLQPPDVPFHFEDVFDCARAAFAYDNYFPSPWSHAKQFEPLSLRREQPVVEPIPRDTYSFRAVTRAAASNGETTPDDGDLSPSSSPFSHSTPDSDLPHSLISPSESPYTQAPSVTVDQPETAPTLSTTLRPSASFPTPYHASSLAPSAADIPEISSTHPLSSTAPTPSPTSSTCLPSVAEEQPEPETESIPSITPAFTFALTPPSSSTFLPSPARSAMNNQPESEHEAASTSMSVPLLSLPLSTLHPLSSVSSTLLLSASPTPFHTHSLARSDAEISSIRLLSSIMPASTMPSISSDFEYLSSATVDQPAPTLSSTPPSSSSISPTFVPSATEHQSEPESAPTLLPSIPTPPSSPSHVHSAINNLASTPPSSSPTSSPCLPSITDDQPDEPEPVLTASFSSLPTLEVSRSPEISLGSLPVALSPGQPFKSLPSEAPGRSSKSCELESTPASAVDIAPLPVSTESPVELSESSLYEPLPILPAPLGTSMTVLVLPNSSLPQRPPRIKTLNSVSSSLEVTSAPTSPATPSVPQPREPLMVYEVMPTLTLHLPLASPSSTPSRSGLAYFNFAFALVSTALVSTLINVSKALSTHSRKLWSKYEDFGNSQIATLNTSSHDVVTQQSRLGQYTPRAARLVFDPGGQPSSVQVSRLPSAHEDVRKRMPKTRNGFITPIFPFPFRPTISPFSTPEVERSC
ncbi:hypothetical protein EDB85DRAFT_2161436 [Lactarius pseudohatsudake]|nr:hypothetical protein EDB85DRAFT_2161436 [Lactarius pseudohatsudake]